MPTYSISFLSPDSGPLRQGHYFIIIRILRLFSSAAIYYVAWFGMRRKYSPATILENKPRSEKQIGRIEEWWDGKLRRLFSENYTIAILRRWIQFNSILLRKFSTGLYCGDQEGIAHIEPAVWHLDLTWLQSQYREPQKCAWNCDASRDPQASSHVRGPTPSTAGEAEKQQLFFSAPWNRIWISEHFCRAELPKTVAAAAKESTQNEYKIEVGCRGHAMFRVKNGMES